MTLNYFDVAMISILSLFSLRGLLRGFVGEVAGLMGIVGGIWIAHRSYQWVAGYLDFIPDLTWRNLAAYALAFLAVLLAVGLLARLLRQILAFSFVAWVDKVAGFLMGLLKGLVICSVLLLLLERFLGDAAFMRDSLVLPYLQAIMQQVRAHLPADILQKFRL